MVPGTPQVLNKYPLCRVVIVYELLVKINAATFCFVNLLKSIFSINGIKNFKEQLGCCQFLNLNAEMFLPQPSFSF